MLSSINTTEMHDQDMLFCLYMSFISTLNPDELLYKKNLYLISLVGLWRQAIKRLFGAILKIYQFIRDKYIFIKN